VLAGGTAPLIATALLFAGSGRPWLIWAYYLVLSAITIVSAVRAPETFHIGIANTSSKRP